MKITEAQIVEKPKTITKYGIVEFLPKIGWRVCQYHTSLSYVCFFDTPEDAIQALKDKSVDMGYGAEVIPIPKIYEIIKIELPYYPIDNSKEW